MPRAPSWSSIPSRYRWNSSRRHYVDRIPKNDAIQNNAQSAELVLHPFPVSLEQLAPAAVEYFLGECVPSLLEVAHSFDAAPVGFAVDDRQDVEGFEDAAVGGDCLAQSGGVPAPLQSPDHIVRADLAGVDR